MNHDYSVVFDTDSEYWARVLEIFEANEKYEKKIVKNRNLHHKFPKSFSKKLGEEIDNDKDNLISLSLSDHFLVHYYYYLLAKKGFRQPMAAAFRLMARSAFKYLTPDTAEKVAKDYAEAREIANMHQSDMIKKAHKRGIYKNKKKQTVEERMVSKVKRALTISNKYTPDELEKIHFEQGKSLRGKTYEEAFGAERAAQLKRKRAESNCTRQQRLGYYIKRTTQPFLKIMCVETGEVKYMKEWQESLKVKSKSSICNVLDKPDKSCRKLHFVRVPE